MLKKLWRVIQLPLRTGRVNESLLRPPDEKSKLFFKERVKRTGGIEFERQRDKRLGQSAGRKIDATEEEFLREIVEQDTTSHGRRHDAVGYMTKGKKI